MKAAILDKITRELSNDIDTEPKALYLLAEIRKFIDGYCQKEKNNYPNLYFYCNWVLHVEMDRTPAKKILNRFESNILGSNKLDEISNIIKKQEKDFYSFVSLKEELQSFLEMNDLPDEIVKSGNKWFKFKKLLVEILIDCPLVNEGGRVSKFSYERGDDKQIRFRVDINEIKRLGSFKVTLKEK
jgi:hypothetical protein